MVATASAMAFAFDGLAGRIFFLDAWRRWPRGPYFSLLVQRKVSKRNTPRRSARRCAAGAQSRREFSDGASCPGRKRRTSLCAALRVLPAGTAGPKGPQKPARTDPACTPLPWLFGVPMRHGEWAGQNPQGAVMDDGVSVWHRDVPYGNSRPARGPGAQRRACRLGCVSLILSLHKQRSALQQPNGWSRMPPRRAAPCVKKKIHPDRHHEMKAPSWIS